MRAPAGPHRPMCLGPCRERLVSAAHCREMTSDALFGLTSCLGQQTEARGTKQYPLLGEATYVLGCAGQDLPDVPSAYA
jgi:hypothetical protein